MRKLSSVWLVLLALALPVLPAAAQTVKVGYVSRDLNYLPYFIAQKKGFYAREGKIGRAHV